MIAAGPFYDHEECNVYKVSLNASVNWDWKKKKERKKEEKEDEWILNFDQLYMHIAMKTGAGL